MFRDPRDVVISEFHMRRDYYHTLSHGISLDDFILRRFEVNDECLCLLRSIY